MQLCSGFFLHREVLEARVTAVYYKSIWLQGFILMSKLTKYMWYLTNCKAAKCKDVFRLACLLHVFSLMLQCGKRNHTSTGLSHLWLALWGHMTSHCLFCQVYRNLIKVPWVIFKIKWFFTKTSEQPHLTPVSFISSANISKHKLLHSIEGCKMLLRGKRKKVFLLLSIILIHLLKIIQHIRLCQW